MHTFHTCSPCALLSKSFKFRAPRSPNCRRQGKRGSWFTDSRCLFSCKHKLNSHPSLRSYKLLLFSNSNLSWIISHFSFLNCRSGVSCNTLQMWCNIIYHLFHTFPFWIVGHASPSTICMAGRSWRLSGPVFRHCYAVSVCVVEFSYGSWFCWNSGTVGVF
jgi:hypothetical protein